MGVWRAEANQEIDSFRSCVRARRHARAAVVGLIEHIPGQIEGHLLSILPFACAQEVFPSPLWNIPPPLSPAPQPPIQL